MIPWDPGGKGLPGGGGAENKVLRDHGKGAGENRRYEAGRAEIGERENSQISARGRREKGGGEDE